MWEVKRDDGDLVFGDWSEGLKSQLFWEIWREM